MRSLCSTSDTVKPVPLQRSSGQGSAIGDGVAVQAGERECVHNQVSGEEEASEDTNGGERKVPLQRDVWQLRLPQGPVLQTSGG